MGVISLQKGARINLTKEAPGLTKIMIGLGWQANQYSDEGFDLDASVFLVDENGVTSPENFIFYNNLIGPNECVKHLGDNRVGGTGDGQNDDEQIYIDLDKIPSNIEKIAIVITIDKYEERKQNFGQVSKSYCRLVNTETNEEQIRLDLGEEFSIETALVMGEIYRNNGQWKFNAVASGFSGGLLAMCKNYKLDAEYR